MRKSLYLAAAAAVVILGVGLGFVVQPKLLATGVAVSSQVASISPLELQAGMNMSALPIQEVVDPF